MYDVKDWAEVHREGLSKAAIAQRLGMSRTTVYALLERQDPLTGDGVSCLRRRRPRGPQWVAMRAPVGVRLDGHAGILRAIADGDDCVMLACAAAWWRSGLRAQHHDAVGMPAPIMLRYPGCAGVSHPVARWRAAGAGCVAAIVVAPVARLFGMSALRSGCGGGAADDVC